MAQRCERPDCSEAATVAYGFDPARAVAWLETLEGGASVHGGLCRRHAEAMVVPKGWWLDDRRTPEQLFLAPRAGGGGRRRPWRSRRVAVEPGVLPLDASDGPEPETAGDRGDTAPIAPIAPIALDPPDDPDEPTVMKDPAVTLVTTVTAGPAGPAALDGDRFEPDAPAAEATSPAPWVPAFAHDDDLDGVLNATSPLLARAFGNVKSAGTRARPPAPGS